MLEGLGSDEVTEWMAWERLIGPLGSARTDYLIAHVCCTMAQCLTTSKGRPPRVQDFLLFNAPWAASRTRGVLTKPEDILAMFRAMAGQSKPGTRKGAKVDG